jgi:putative hemolysin
MLFRAHPNSLCMSAARIFRVINFLLGPLVVLVEEISQLLLRWTGGHAFTGRVFGNREELRAVMQESGGMLSDDEHAMVNRILDLQNYTVGQIARPMAETAGIDADKPVRDAFAVAGPRNFSRLPVWETRDGKRRVAGLLDVGPLLYRESFDAEKPAAAYMIPALFVDETLRLEIALRLMQRSGQRMAIVLARDRSEIGVVAVKDILKVMFGDMKL